MFEMIGVGLGGVANVNGFLGSQVDLSVDVGRLMGGLADALRGMQAIYLIIVIHD